MRGPLLAVGFAVAVGATAGLAYLAMRPAPPDPLLNPPPDPERYEPAEDREAAEKRPAIRPYETTATLVEDLRDALAGDHAALDDEVWRVSRALGSSARWTLTKLATEDQEANPRVRALLVLAAGVHVQGEGLLLLRMGDSDARVRTAAILAAGYRSDGRKREFLGVSVPVGRTPDERMLRALAKLAEEDKDPTVRETARSVGSKAG